MPGPGVNRDVWSKAEGRAAVPWFVGSLPVPDRDSTARMMRTVIQEAQAPPSAVQSLVRDRGLITVLAGERAGTLYRLDGLDFIIGRGEEAHIRLFDDGLSRNHARIFRRGPLFLLEDLGSTNGTYFGTERVDQPVPLEDEARIGLGRHTVLKFSLKDSLEEQLLVKQYESTVRDQLTGAYNRRALDERLKSEFAFAQRHQTQLGVFMLDIDFFKKVNDTHGHAAGDAVLRGVSQRIISAVRTEDFFARFGGEEFCLIVRGVDPRQAGVFGERLRVLVQEQPVVHEGESIRVTASFGYNWVGPDRRVLDQEALTAGADAALYEAKRRGRNQIVLCR